MKFEENKNYSDSIMEALKTNDEEKIKSAIQKMHDSIVASIKKDYEEVNRTNDTRILTERGYKELTKEERTFYEKFIATAKSSNPKQELADLINLDGGMPETIFEDVYRDLVREHPLLNRIKFQNVQYLTKWLLNDHTADKAIWGEINSEITKQIESSFKAIDIVQGKLSAFVVIALDMLELGPTFLNAYITEILKEALAAGLEYGIVKGIGVLGEPIGLIRDISEGVSVSSTEGYPSKTAVAVTSFDIKDYCDLIAENLLTKENGNIRTISQVQLLVNPVDYLRKIVPATTVRATDGTYKNDLFPFPTEAIQTTALDEGEAVLCLLDEYFLGIGGSKESSIVYSDEFKFLEDKRVYKIKKFAAGRCEDNTSAVLLDISKLEETYITVKVAESTDTTA